jgi:hypothetical protein
MRVERHPVMPVAGWLDQQQAAKMIFAEIDFHGE